MLLPVKLFGNKGEWSLWNISEVSQKDPTFQMSQKRERMILPLKCPQIKWEYSHPWNISKLRIDIFVQNQVSSLLSIKKC